MPNFFLFRRVLSRQHNWLRLYFDKEKKIAKKNFKKYGTQDKSLWDSKKIFAHEL